MIYAKQWMEKSEITPRAVSGFASFAKLDSGFYPEIPRAFEKARGKLSLICDNHFFHFNY